MRFQRMMPLIIWTAAVFALQSCASTGGLPTADNFAQGLLNEKIATTFERLSEGAGGFDALLGKEKHTLVVPVDASFSEMGMEQLMVLMSPGNTAAGTEIVKGHTAGGAFSPKQMPGVGNLTMLNGKKFAVTSTASGLQIGGASVIKTVKTRQGYIYFVNRILK